MFVCFVVVVVGWCSVLFYLNTSVNEMLIDLAYNFKADCFNKIWTYEKFKISERKKITTERPKNQN